MLVGIKESIVCNSSAFMNETELQDLIEERPSVLSVISKINKQESPLVIIGRELSVQSGAIDFLAVDIEGNLYIIETKLAQNPELRRTVIGQVLEYSSNLRDMPYDVFDKMCSRYLKESLTVKMQKAFPQSPDAGRYGEILRQKLKEGGFSIIIVANNVNFEIQRLFNYIDEITAPRINFLVLEVNKYQLDGKIYLHSNVVWAAKYIRSLFSRKVISEQEYLESKSDHVRQLIAFIDKWCLEKDLMKTQTTKGVSWVNENGGGSIFVSNDWLDTNWSTINNDSEAVKNLKRKQIAKAEKSGFKTRHSKAGGIKLLLNNQTSQSQVEHYLSLVFPVLEKVRLNESVAK